MSQATGSVTVNDSPTKSRLYRFCEKKIDQWIKSRFDQASARSLGPETEAPVEFTVSFTEEGGTRQVSCLAEIQLGERRYRGFDLACDPQMAFMHALKRLQPN